MERSPLQEGLEMFSPANLWRIVHAVKLCPTCIAPVPADNRITRDEPNECWQDDPLQRRRSCSVGGAAVRVEDQHKIARLLAAAELEAGTRCPSRAVSHHRALGYLVWAGAGSRWRDDWLAVHLL